MQDRPRRHYRVAQKEIYEDPCEGIYVTKEEQKWYFLATAGLILLSFLALLPLAIRRK